MSVFHLTALSLTDADFQVFASETADGTSYAVLRLVDDSLIPAVCWSLLSVIDAG